MEKILFVPIAKVDVEKREVSGRAVHEVPDKTKEIFDYATSKPLFSAWSADFEKVTDGKSLGNIRAMHGKVAAGKVTSIDFNDTEKAIDITAKIVDDAEWQKCLEGVYTGFSIGGSYEKKWDDNGLKRYTARPSEISIVDNPCVPTARFTMVKADGVTEEKEFKAATEAATETPVAPAPDPAATGGEAAKAAAADKTDPAVEPVDTPVNTGSSTAAQKSLYSIQNFASVLSSIAAVCSDAQWEAIYENDGSPVPSQLRDWLKSGLEILGAMTAEESAELVSSLASKADEARGLSKATKHAQSIHDSSVAMGASCSSSKAERSQDLAKITGDLEKVTTECDTLKKRVAELEAEPAPPKGVAKVVVGKEADSAIAKVNEEPEDNTPLGLMKKAQSKPHVIVKV